MEASVHPRIIRYIQGFHDNDQSNPFIDFEGLSQKIVKRSQDRKDLADSYMKECRKNLGGDS